MIPSAPSAEPSDAFGAPRATVSITTRQGLAAFDMDPVRVFHLSRSLLDPDNTQLSRRPHCPQIVYVNTGWMLVNRSTKVVVRAVPPLSPWSEIPPGRAHVFSAGTTQIQLLVAHVGAVTVSIAPAAPDGAEASLDLVSGGRSTIWGPEMNAEAAKLLRSSSRKILVAVLAPWLSGDPMVQELKNRKVAAQCAGYSVASVDRALSRLRNALWPDEHEKPSREHIAEYLSLRGLLGPEDVLEIDHLHCGHRSRRTPPPRTSG